jgi:hypothetical protein
MGSFIKCAGIAGKYILMRAKNNEISPEASAEASAGITRPLSWH